MNVTCLSVLGLEQSCNKCATSFKDNDTKHHCRACGEGFCDSCSSKTRPVPERGWGPAPVRVCDNCYEARNSQLGNVGPGNCKGGGGTSLLGIGCWERDPHLPNPVPHHVTLLRVVAPRSCPVILLSSLLTGSWGATPCGARGRGHVKPVLCLPQALD